MAEEIARIGVYGDIHLNSKNYGAHKDYARESMDYFTKITEIAERRKLTHLIGCGDFSYGRFHSLEYRAQVESNLQRQFEVTHGNRYELHGNHDSAGYGMTELEYYVSKGLIKPSCNLTVGNLHITMVDYGKHLEVEPNIDDTESSFNFVIAHDFFKFEKTAVANFGKSIELDNFSKWFGADCLICGHVHKILDFSGYILKNDMAHECQVHYLGCMTRPAYREGLLDEVGQVMVITVFDDGKVDFEMETIQLWDIEDSFNLAAKEAESTKKEEKSARVDISDVVKQLDAHDRNVGNPEDIIAGLEDIEEKYKNKAIELLHEAGE